MSERMLTFTAHRLQACVVAGGREVVPLVVDHFHIVKLMNEALPFGSKCQKQRLCISHAFSVIGSESHGGEPYTPVLLLTIALNISLHDLLPIAQHVMRPAIVGSGSFSHDQCEYVGQFRYSGTGIKSAFKMLEYTGL